MMLFRTELSCSENEPGRVLGALVGRMFRSDDYGKNWEPATTGLVATAIERIVFDPQDANAAYCSDTRHVWRTADRGKTWERMPLEEYWFVRQITFSPDGKHVFVVFNGVWRGTRDGKEWQHVWRPTDQSAQPMGVFFCGKAGTNGEAQHVMVLVGNGFVLESTDNGTTWDDGGESTLEFHPTQYVKRFSQRAVGDREIWFAHDLHGAVLSSTDHGRTWERYGQTRHYRVSASSFADDGSMWIVSRDKLHYLPPVEQRPPQFRSWRLAEFTAVVCDPADARLAYVARQDGTILRTVDGGETFEALDGGPTGIEVMHLALSPHDGSLWVATTGNGVWILDNPKTHPGKRLTVE